jgi:hypothetical protein
MFRSGQVMDITGRSGILCKRCTTMVEVFKTNVRDQQQAELLLEQIHFAFANYTANFDLDDCDRVLRVECATGVQSLPLLNLLTDHGVQAAILPE